MARALAGAGVRLVFSGHLHMAAVTRKGGLTDIAAPSLASYPGGWLLVTLDGAEVTVETVSQSALPVPPAIRAAHASELALNPDARLDPLAAAGTLGDLMVAHARLMVTRRYLRRDWHLGPGTLPADATLADVAAMAGPVPPALSAALGTITALEFLQDFALVRSGGDRALADLPAGRAGIVAALADHLAAEGADDTAPARYAALARAFLDRIATPAGAVSLRLD